MARRFQIVRLVSGGLAVEPEGYIDPRVGRSLAAITAETPAAAAAAYQATLRELAAKLGEEWFGVGGNDGTFGAAECCRAVGTGDPAFGRVRIEARVRDKATREIGCDSSIAPGRIIYDWRSWEQRRAAYDATLADARRTIRLPRPASR